MYCISGHLSDGVLKFTNHLQNVSLNDKEFLLIKEGLHQQQEEEKDVLPRDKALSTFRSIMRKDYIVSSNFGVFKNSSIFNQKVGLLMSNPFIKVLIYGNIDKESAIQLCNNITTSLATPSNNNAKTPENIDYLNTNIDIKGYNIYREKLRDNHNYDHAIINYYQIGDDTLSNMIMTEMIRTIVGNVYFTELRVKEQLGYSTKGKIINDGSKLYYCILVQGSRVQPDVIDNKIENVLDVMRERIEKIDEKMLEKWKLIVVRRFKKRDKTLGDRSDRIWYEIISKRNYFNIRSLIKKYIQDYNKSINKQSLLHFFDLVFIQDLGKLSIQYFNKSINTEHMPEKVEFIKRGNTTLNIEPVLIKNINHFRDNFRLNTSNIINITNSTDFINKNLN